MLSIVRSAVPTFFRIVVCEALVVPTRCGPKSSDDGVRVTAGTGFVPSPLNTSSRGLLAASSVIVSEALRLPADEGANVTEIVQLAAASSTLGATGHVFVCA